MATLALPPLDFEPWVIEPMSKVADEIAAACSAGLGPAGMADGSAPRRALVLVDGSTGSGKTTFTRRLRAALPGAAFVGIDDVSWHLHPVNWVNEMLNGVVTPWLAGADIDYRPPGWVAKGREGSIKVTGSGGRPICIGGRSGDTERSGDTWRGESELGGGSEPREPARRGDGILIVEGVGAGRGELAELASYLVWVNTDQSLSRERVLVRDIGIDGDTPDEVSEFHAWWMTEEVPFHLREQPWLRANLIVDGSFGGPVTSAGEGEAASDSELVRVAHR